jgi:hypothetical protein
MMSKLNKLFPEILLAEMAGTNCELTPVQCYELSMYASNLELENTRLHALLDGVVCAICGRPMLEHDKLCERES